VASAKKRAKWNWRYTKPVDYDAPLPEDMELEMVDLDVQIEQLPPRRSEQVMVRFTQGSYRLPRLDGHYED